MNTQLNPGRIVYVPELPKTIHPLALSDAHCDKCKGQGQYYRRSGVGHRVPPQVCECVKRNLAKKLAGLDKYERLYVESKLFPHNFPPHPVPESSFPRMYALDYSGNAEESRRVQQEAKPKTMTAGRSYDY